MARHDGLPRPPAFKLSKSALLGALVAIDKSKASMRRILKMETAFREKIGFHVESLPGREACFGKFNTNPFVLLFHCFKKQYRNISQIEEDILPAKVFSSMETSAGRMVEAVVLPIYSWQCVASEMHSSNSVLDGKKLAGDTLCVTTLKSGPRCLNDEMSENIADAIIANGRLWAAAGNVRKIDFTYGVLYGTKRQSNKKDWHILRNLVGKLPNSAVRLRPSQGWRCEFEDNGVQVAVTIRIGVELWNYLAGADSAFVELCVALIRACVLPSEIRSDNHAYTIADLADIVSLEPVPLDFNVSILQRSQLEWLFFVARHFCDELLPRDLAEIE